ncbi:tRNA splicing endonuclease subunit 54 isoform X1 [Amblyomma americanum]
MAAEAVEDNVDVVLCDENAEEKCENGGPASEKTPTPSSTEDDFAYRLPSGEAIYRAHNSRVQDNATKSRIGSKRLDPTGSAEEVELIESLRNDRAEALNRVGSFRPIDVLQALWEEEEKRVVVTKHKGAYLKFMGFKVGDRTVLNPLEALFLLEANQLLLMRAGVPVSISEAYELLLEDGDHYDKYLVYAHLMRAGYIVIPHKTRQSSKPAATAAAKVEADTEQDEAHESDDDVVCLDDSDDSDISVVKVVPPKLPKLDPSITITPITRPKRAPSSESQRTQCDLSFPKYVAGELLTLKRPPRHLLPRNVLPSREWYEVHPDRWNLEDSVRDKWKGRSRPTNLERRGYFGRRDLEEWPQLQCQGNGQAWQAPNTSWGSANRPALVTPEQNNRDSRTWNDIGADMSSGRGTGHIQAPHHGGSGDGHWNSVPRPPYDGAQCRPWLGGPEQPAPPWDVGNFPGTAGLQRLPPPPPLWRPSQPSWHAAPPPLRHRPPLQHSNQPWNSQDNTRQASGDQYGYFTEPQRCELPWQMQRPGPDLSFHSGPGRPDRQNLTPYRRSGQRNDSSPRHRWQGRPHRPSPSRRGGGVSDEDEYPSAVPSFTGKVTSWAELKSGLAQAERTEALLAGEGGVLWKGSVQPLIMPTQDLSIPGIVSQLAVMEEVDVVNGKGCQQSGGSSTCSSLEPVAPDLDVYLPGAAYSKRNPGPPECRVSVVRWDDGPPHLRDLARRQVTPADSVPLVFAVVDQGQVQLYAFDVVVAPRFVPGP